MHGVVVIDAFLAMQVKLNGLCITLAITLEGVYFLQVMGTVEVQSNAVVGPQDFCTEALTLLVYGHHIGSRREVEINRPNKRIGQLALQRWEVHR